MVFLSSLAEEDFLKLIMPSDDPYKYADYTDKYQMSAFFSEFIWNFCDLLLVAYLLNVAHLYVAWQKDKDSLVGEENEERADSLDKLKDPILPSE